MRRDGSVSRARWARQERGDVTRIAARAARGWDLAVRMALPDRLEGPDARFRARLAHQIRKDLWRDLRRLRGFAPIVEIAQGAGGLQVTAGGSLLAGPAPAGTTARIADLLADRHRQQRWLAFAARPEPGPRSANGAGHPRAL
ncbi:MAG: hypothetical protein AAFR46_17180 [Pseudomonadota bacterium]